MQSILYRQRAVEKCKLQDVAGRAWDVIRSYYFTDCHHCAADKTSHPNVIRCDTMPYSIRG